jgi:ABC-type phosphate/phosphonate transport system permease subunit
MQKEPTFWSEFSIIQCTVFHQLMLTLIFLFWNFQPIRKNILFSDWLRLIVKFIAIFFPIGWNFRNRNIHYSWNIMKYLHYFSDKFDKLFSILKYFPSVNTRKIQAKRKFQQQESKILRSSKKGWRFFQQKFY